jgi:hypothetical protein
MFVQDYSGFTRAAEIQAQGMANLGAGIGQVITQAGDYFKQQGEAKKSAQLGIKIAEAAKIMDPQQAPYYDNLIFSMKDENTPVQVRGALGASVQDLLKQNTSMRAVAVQEAQVGRMPGYFGGGYGRPQASSRGYGRAAGTPAQGGVDASAIDPNLTPVNDSVLPGMAGADVNAAAQAIARAQELGISASEINPTIEGLQLALSSPFDESQAAVKGHMKNLAQMVANAEANFEPAKDSKGQPLVILSEDESGNISRYTKTKGGNLITTSGTVLTAEGKPIEQQQYKKFDVEAIDRALYQNYDMDGRPIPQGEPGSVLPGLPQGDAGNLPPEASRTRPPSFQELTAVPPTPEGGVQRIGEQEPKPEQKSAGLGLMAKESQVKQAQASSEELKRLTELTPRKQNLYNSALNQAYQDPKTAPSQDVVDELQLQLLMQPESKGAQVMSETEYNQRNVAAITKAAKRVGDRSAAEAILSRFDTAQKLANHPEGYKVFGKSIPEATLRELARTQGDVYALYNNLKGQDLVQAMRDIKAQSGTAAGMSEKETMALQRAVNDLDLAQDWKSAQSTLMRIASGTVRAGKKLGLDESVFEVMPMTPATGTTPASKRQKTKAEDILNNPEAVPLFRDEIQYFNRVNSLKSRLQGGQGAGTTQPAPQAQPQSQPSAVTPMGLESIFFPTR